MSYLYKYFIGIIVAMILLSINLVISLLFTTLLCGLLFFYIRQRNDAIETRMTTLFNLIQSEAEKQHAYRLAQTTVQLRGGGGMDGVRALTSAPHDPSMFSHLISNTRIHSNDLKEVDLEDEEVDVDGDSDENGDGDGGIGNLIASDSDTNLEDDAIETIEVSKEGSRGEHSPMSPIATLAHELGGNIVLSGAGAGAGAGTGMGVGPEKSFYNVVDTLVMNMNSGVLNKNARQILESFDTIHAINMVDDIEGMGEMSDDIQDAELMGEMDAYDDLIHSGIDEMVGVSASDVRRTKNIVVNDVPTETKHISEVSDDVIGCEVLDDVEVPTSIASGLVALAGKSQRGDEPRREDVLDQELAEAILVRHDVSEDIHKIAVSDDEYGGADADADADANTEMDSVSMTGSAVGSVMNGASNPYSKIPVALLRQMIVDRKLTESASAAAKLKKKQIVEMLVHTV